MIESNIIDWVEIGDTVQHVDVYHNGRSLILFSCFKLMLRFELSSTFFHIILKFFFFLQIILLTITCIKEENDSTLKVLNSLTKVVFIHKVITNRKSYQFAVALNFIITLISIFAIIYMVMSVKYQNIRCIALMYVISFFIEILMNYLIGPIIAIGITAMYCNGGTHIYLKDKCYSTWMHLILLICSIITIIFWLVISILLSLYHNEIGGIKRNNILARINCNYEFFINIAKIAMFIFSSILLNYYSNSTTIRLIFQIYMCLNCLFFVFYIKKFVLYCDSRMNAIVLYGWVFSLWFSFAIVLKHLLNIVDSTLFIIIGWIVLSIIIYISEENSREYILTERNIFEANSLKEIELYVESLLMLIKQSSIKAKTLLNGVRRKFEENTKSNVELSQKFSWLISNEFMKTEFNSITSLPILSIILLVYEHYLEKGNFKSDILINMCYFLLNKIKNPTFAVSLCAKYKVSGHKHLYLKYILSEEIKEFFENKLSKSNNKESIRHIQIGSVILHNLYMDLFKLKIYDATFNQVEYFDLLKSTICSNKTTEHLLKLGEEIIKLRKDIMEMWDKLLHLNPFSEESAKDYMLYLNTILEDDILARTEEKRFLTLRNNKLSEKNNIYHSMFLPESSSVILSDGNSSSGKILYSTPNFPTLFNFSGKEILNLSINDILPNAVREFHQEIIDYSMQFSNIEYIFKSQKDILLKGKTGGIFNIQLYVKAMPNLSFGLIYIILITKQQNRNFIIVLDRDLNINGLSDVSVQISEHSSMSNYYGLIPSLCGHHIGLVLPELLQQLEYKKDRFIFTKSEIDLKGNLYSITNFKEIEENVDKVLERIKQKGRLQNEDGSIEYDDLIKCISEKVSQSFSIFYKIISKSFLKGKYVYHRVYITNDLIALNDNGAQIYSEKMKNSKDILGTKTTSIKSHNINNNIGSRKQIKLQGGRKESEIDKKEEKIDENKKEEIKEEKENDEVKPVISQSSSAFTKTSMDSTNFNKIKNRILGKKEISLIKLSKCVSLLFIAVTITLYVLNTNSFESNTLHLNDYLQQNLFFNHTKIDISCIYISTLNLKWVKDQFIKENMCYLRNNCSEFYSEQLLKCLLDQKKQKDNSSYFYSDYKEIINHQREIELEVYNLSNKNLLIVDIENILNLFLSNGLKLIPNLELYYTDDNVFEINSANILIQAIALIEDTNITGFNDDEKEKKVHCKFSPFPIFLVVYLGVILIFFFAFGYAIYKINSLETLYLIKLIDFNSQSFDAYIKNLEELKKKLRSEGSEENSNGDGQIEISSKKEEKSEDKEKKEGDNENDKDKENDDNGQKNNKKKKKLKDKLAKIQKQKNQKKKKMSLYFFKWNIFLSIRIFTVLFISFTYFIVISLLNTMQKKEFLTFDATTNAIEGVYKESFDIFISFKKQLAAFEDYELAKQKGIIALQSGKASVKVNEIEYTNVNELNNTRYTMTLPLNNETYTPKLGNYLLLLLSELNDDSKCRNNLYQLYSSNACGVMFPNESSSEYEHCASFWSTILVKGMEQAITQMGIVVNSAKDELRSLNDGIKDINILLRTESSFSQYELFIEYYLLNAYFVTVELFRELKEMKVIKINNTYSILLYCYITGVIMLFILLIYLVFSVGALFNKFLNFIGIIPAKFIIEDTDLYKQILLLEHDIL